MKYIYKIRLILAVIIFIFTILGITGLFYPIKFFDIQFAPLIQRVFVDFSIIAAVLLISIIILTLLYGRFYCSILCPYGIIQELAAIVLKKENEYIKSYPVKYFIAAVVFGILTGASAFAIRYLEPYTYFGSAFSLSILGIFALIAVIALVFFKNRFFCTNICPAGAVLGLLSKISLNKIYIKDNCISCGQCERNCPSGSINAAEGTVDNETCVKCLKCIGLCPKSAIKYEIKPKEEVKFNLKRRQIIISGAVIALFGTMVKAGIIIKDKAVQKFKDIILPPGAASEEEFINKCYNCNLCVSNCPNKIIVKADKDFPVVHIDYNKKRYCDKNCNKCSQVCPTGAIKRISLKEKQRTRIAMAMINQEKCTKCGLCFSACPYGAVNKETDKQFVIDGSKCTGCGKCKSECYYDAINIYSVKKQSII